MSKIQIQLLKGRRVKNVESKLGDALVRLGYARHYERRDMVAETNASPVIPIPPPAPLSSVRADVPPEVEAETEFAEAKVDGVATSPESRASAAPGPDSTAAAATEPAAEATPPVQDVAERDAAENAAAQQGRTGRGRQYRRSDIRSRE
jgi:hypothetical protein